MSSTSLNSAAAAHAAALIKAGSVDKTSSWSFSGDDGNTLLGPKGDDWSNYAQWFLAVHGDQPDKTKAHYGYPYGKGGKVYRGAIIAIKQRAAQQGDASIEAAASAMLNKIDGKAADVELKFGEEMNRAYSTIDIKSFSDSAETRTFKGIASTPSIDMGGDIMEPMGAQFKAPIPLLWQHDAKQPIGMIHKITPTSKGIEIEGEIPVVKNPGRFKDRIDEAWDTLKSKLVRGLSIGFRGLTGEEMKDGSGGTHYKTWALLEVSAVTIPMNMDANITSVKSADQAILDEVLAAEAAALRIAMPKINVTKGLPIVKLK